MVKINLEILMVVIITFITIVVAIYTFSYIDNLGGIERTGNIGFDLLLFLLAIAIFCLLLLYWRKKSDKVNSD